MGADRTATSEEAAAAFKNTVKNIAVNFDRTSVSSDDQTGHFREILADLRIPPSEAAILVEDETAFAGSIIRPAPKQQFPRTLRFPREISHLRNVYSEASVASHSQNAPAPDIEFSLKDPESGEDSVPVFSRTQTPLSQNAVIGEITREIQRDRIRIVELAATNVLDLLFLTKVLRRQCPDTRLLIISPDLLFVQESQAESLTGTLALSGYPLFFASKQWLDAQVTHANENAEGLYNAVRLFLLPESARPFHPSWLMMLNRQGFSPIKFMPNKDEQFQGRFHPPAKPSFRLNEPPSSWVIITSLLSALSTVLCGWIVHLERDPKSLSWSLPALDGNHVADAYRLMCLLVVLLTLAAMQAVLCIPLIVHSHSNSENVWVYVLAITGTLLPIVLSAQTLKQIRQKPRNSRLRRAYVAVIAIWWLGVLIAWMFCCLSSRGQVGFFFSFRVLELQLGSSPALPLLALMSALLILAVCHLARFYFAISQRPRMFTAGLDKFFNGRIRKSRRDLNRTLAAPMNWSPKRHARLLSVAVGIAVVFAVLSRADINLGSTDGRIYDCLLIFLLGVVTVGIAATAVQIRISWALFQPMLATLNMLPIGYSFTRVKEPDHRGPIWARRFNLQSLDAPVRSATVLHNLRVFALQASWQYAITHAQLEQWLRTYWLHISRLIGARRANIDRSEQRWEFRRLRYQAAYLTHEPTEAIILPEWRARVLACNASAASSSQDQSSKPAPQQERDACDLAQSFVALQYSMFINYGVRQIQNLILAVSLGFGLLVIALNVYPLQSPQSVHRMLLTAFVALGYVIWRVLSQMERDPILSRLSGSTEGQLNKEFYLKLIGYGALPVMSLLASQFPTIGGLLSSWVQPSLEALR